MKHELNAALIIAYRDIMKFLRDRSRIIATFIFPFIFIGILGQGLESNIGSNIGYNFLLFTFIGVLAQTLFQSTSSGLISLVEDRENDFSQEIFISPISRYTIIIGKILGETLVSLVQIVGIIIMGIILQVPFSPIQLITLIPAAIIVCLFGGAFGLLVLANLNSQRAANQIFPFLILPQFFLAGVFNPIKHSIWYLQILSHLAPMTYAVDLIRSIYYLGSPDYSKVVLYNPLIDFTIVCILFIVFFVLGTYLFVKNESNR